VSATCGAGVGAGAASGFGLHPVNATTPNKNSPLKQTRFTAETVRAPGHRLPKISLKVCLKNRNWAAAGNFGCARGELFRASPKRAVRNGPTKRTGKSTAAGQFPIFRQTLTIDVGADTSKRTGCMAAINFGL
jgi:hypothetical protein